MKWKLLESATKFNFNNRLNPVLWDKDNKLRAEVKVKILEFVEEFCSTLDIPLNILDIEIVGSNASYNYTKKSDVDVHIITNFESYEIIDMSTNNTPTDDYPDFAFKLYEHIKELDIEFKNENVVSVINDDVKIVKTNSNEYLCFGSISLITICPSLTSA